MALLNLVYRDQLFPRASLSPHLRCTRAELLPEKQACRVMVDLLALAHERGCEAELAERLAADLEPAGCRTWRHCAPVRAGSRADCPTLSSTLSALDCLRGARSACARWEAA